MTDSKGAVFALSAKELERYTIIQRLIQGKLTQAEAAKQLGLGSTRQVRNIRDRFLKEGKAGVVHKLRGRPSNHTKPKQFWRTVIAIVRREYWDFGPTFAAEKLAERNHIVVDHDVLRRHMITAGVWKPKKRKMAGTYHAWLPRKEAYGQMVQFDGSYHDWLETRGPRLCLLAAIDDATSTVIAIFDDHEGVRPVFRFWRGYVLTHGKPHSVYVDRFSTYKMQTKHVIDNPELKTQFERLCLHLGIERITAHSSQAKGRVENLFGTLQDRLVKELRLAKISTRLQANRFLQDVFLPQFNAKFSIPAHSPHDLHRPLSRLERRKLDSLFSVQHERVVTNDYVASFKGHWLQLTKQQPINVFPKNRVTIEERLDGSLWIRLRGKYLSFVVLPTRPAPARAQPAWTLAARIAPPIAVHTAKPSINHP